MVRVFKINFVYIYLESLYFEPTTYQFSGVSNQNYSEIYTEFRIPIFQQIELFLFFLNRFY